MTHWRPPSTVFLKELHEQSIFTDKESSNSSHHFIQQPKFILLLQPIIGPGSLSQYHKMKTNKNRSVSIPSSQCSNKNLLLACSFYAPVFSLSPSWVASFLYSLTDQNMGFKAKFPALLSTQTGSLFSKKSL